MKDTVKCSNKNCGLITNISQWRLVPDKENPRVTHQHCPRCDCDSFYEAKPGETEKVKSGAQLIALERQRQTKIEGWTPEHDDKHGCGELCSAAVCYTVAGDCLANAKSLMGESHVETPEILTEEIMEQKFGIGVAWPWDEEWLKISPDPIRNLVKAGALIAAEIDRLQRAASVQNEKLCRSRGDAGGAQTKETND